MQEITTEKIPIKMWLNHIEAGALEQTKHLANLPFAFKHIAIMPDAHEGYGMPIGGVLATQRVIIPNAVGVDIGCGMIAMRTSMTSHDMPDNLKELRKLIERAVPHGRNKSGGRNDKGSWKDLPTPVARAWRDRLEPDFKQLLEKYLQQ